MIIEISMCCEPETILEDSESQKGRGYGIISRMFLTLVAFDHFQ